MPDNSPHQLDMKSTIDDLERFKQSAVFADFATLIRIRTAVIQSELESPDLTLEALRYRQGELSGLKYWISLPERLVESLKEMDKNKGDLA